MPSPTTHYCPDRRPNAQPHSAPAPPLYQIVKTRILFVDDEPSMLRVLKMGMRSMADAWDMEFMASGEEALARLGEGLPCDLVILDMNMPGMGGAATLPRIRAMRPDLPILLATGRTDQQAMDLVASVPLTTLLAKPFTLDELKRHLMELG